MENSVFVKSVFVLMVGGLVAKVIGAVYRIPLTWVLGAEGLGWYQLIYPIFALLLVLSSTGAPTAISTMVAERISKNNYANANKVLRVSVVILLIIGLLSGAILAGLSGVLARLQGSPQIMPLYITISCAIPLVSVLSAYRGYFQGYMNMLPTAISQIIEQLAKLVLGLGFAIWFLKYGILFATFGAICGVVLGELFAVLYIVIYYLRHKTKLLFKFNQHEYHEATKTVVREFFANSLPIILCSFVLPLLQMIDSLLVIKLLAVGGVEAETATIMWGICSGVVGSLINLPTALTQSVGMSVAPNISDVNDKEQIKNVKIEKAYKMAINLSLPLSIVLFSMSGVIIPFLYQQTIQDINLATSLLMLYAPFVIIISLTQVQNAVLQGLKLSKIALKNMLIAGVCKISLLLVLTTLQSINIYGVVLSNIVFYMIVSMLNAISLRKKTCLKFSFKGYVPSVLSSFLMGVYVYVGTIAFKWLSVYWQLPVLLLIGVTVYLSTLWVLGGLVGVGGWLKELKIKFINKKLGKTF